MHDPDSEVTVISAEGIGKGVLEGNTIRMVKEPVKLSVEDCCNLSRLTIHKHVNTITNAANDLDRDIISDEEFEEITRHAIINCIREVMEP